MRRESNRPRIFVSHSSKDKTFVRRLVDVLSAFSLNVWYDDWEIGVGDSIVDKVFDGLAASDTLVIVLSKSSVESRWVKEELTVAVMRRLSEQNIRIMPVLVDDCEIPTTLKHIKYADFRTDEQGALSGLLEAITPRIQLERSLSALYDSFCSVCDELKAMSDEAQMSDGLVRLNSLLESALGIRIEVEFRNFPSEMRQLSFFEQIDSLSKRGIDVRDPDTPFVSKSTIWPPLSGFLLPARGYDVGMSSHLNPQYRSFGLEIIQHELGHYVAGRVMGFRFTGNTAASGAIYLS
jgi:hypothetical protein